MEFIGLKSVSHSVRQIVLNCIGGERLRKLLLVDCVDVDPIEEFSRFTRLENLRIQNSAMVPIEDDLAQRIPPSILADCGQFLPNLKTLSVVGTCLGHWSRLFECRRRSLTALQLTCCHIGHPSMGRFNWSDTPRIWPNLQELTLFHPGRQDLLEQIVIQLSRFNNFQILRVPPCAGLRTKNLMAQVENEMVTGIHVDCLSKSYSNTPCIYQ